MKIPHCSALYRYWLNCANRLPRGEVVGAKQTNKHTSYFSLFLCSYDKHHGEQQLREERAYFILQYVVYHKKKRG